MVGSRATTFVLAADGRYARDDSTTAITDAALRDLARQPGQQMTYTCMPPGWAPKL